MQIYTRVGDKGKTKIIGNYTVSKDSARVEAYGTVDELNSLIGIAQSSKEAWPELKAELQEIQQLLFDCGNDLATTNTEKYPYRTDKKPTEWLEQLIDKYAAEPKDVENFILPGGTRLAAELHYCRTVTRRAERTIVALNNQIQFSKENGEYETKREEAEINPQVLIFINRLSDFFFAVARVANHRSEVEDVLYEKGGKVFHLDVTKEDFK